MSNWTTMQAAAAGMGLGFIFFIFLPALLTIVVAEILLWLKRK